MAHLTSAGQYAKTSVMSIEMRKKRYYATLGLPVRWIERTNAPMTTTTTKETPVSCSFDDLKQKVQACTACPLHQTRTQTVFGVGNSQASLMFIGEAPGFYEDQQGEPFVGRAGQLLNAMLHAIGYSREEVYIANILKCRPPNNRDPQLTEIHACSHFLQQQIVHVNPQLLVAVGRIAAHALLDTTAPLGQLRSKIHTDHASHRPLIVTYHPAYLLRNPKDKKKAFSDLLFIHHTLQSQQAIHRETQNNN